MASASASTFSRAGGREVVAVSVILAALVGVQLVATNSTYLLHKYFWTDELATFALITDPDWSHALRAMRGSVDINPPGVHILLLAFTTIVRSTSEVALRSFALVTMLIALTGIYAGLRTKFSRAIAFTATLAVWSHPLILDHAFEVRYYGPWLAAAVWFCVLLGRARERTLGAPGTVLLGATAFFVCTSHYLGIVSLIIIVAVEAFWNRGRSLYSRGAMAAIAVGPLATITAAIFLLPAQRAATSVRTWVPDPSWATVFDFASTIFFPMHLAALLIAVLLWRAQMKPAAGAAQTKSASSPTVLALASLALLVPALIVFSLLVQPVLISRYGLVAIAAIGPLMAAALSEIPGRAVLAAAVLLVAASGYQLHQRAARAQAMDADRQQLIADIRTRTGADRVVFEAPHQLNVVWHYAPDLRNRLYLMDFEKGELGDNVSTFRIWSRDLAREFRKFYDGPPLLPWSGVRSAPTVFVIPHYQAYKTEPAPDRRYPDFVMKPVQGQVQQLVRSDAR